MPRDCHLILSLNDSRLHLDLEALFSQQGNYYIYAKKRAQMSSMQFIHRIILFTE